MFHIPNSQSIAVLIDSDNFQLSLLNYVIKFADHCGDVALCRAYGDWKKPTLYGSQKAVRKLGVEIVQVDATAKDTTDKQLMIEAGEILGQNHIDIFIIVTGDGDFRQLCQRIKQKGRTVIGIGNEGQSSTALKTACDAFFHIEDLCKSPIPAQRMVLLLEAYHQTRSENGRSHIGQMGQLLRQLDRQFKTHFAGKRLSKWLDMYPHLFNRDGDYIRLTTTNL